MKTKINISIVNDSKKWSKRLKKVRKIVDSILKYPLHFIDRKYSVYQLTILLSDNKGIKKLNKKYRDINKSTDVLTFSNSYKISKNENINICDIILSADYIKIQCLKNNINFYDHTSHLIVHGLLHNNGHDHKSLKKAKVMKNLEILILKKMNIENPYQNI